MADSKLFYDQEETCPVCQKKFSVRKVRRSMCAVSRRDTDFSVTYQNVNPNIYSVWVCPHCGYAASESNFAEISPPDQERLERGLAEQGYLGIDFSGERDVQKGITAFLQAIKCTEMKGARASAFASLYLRLAWLYRSTGDPREAECLAKSLENYEKAYNTEPMPIGKMSEVAITYLIGELHRRTGNMPKAVLWYSQVVGNPKARMEPQILQLARDGWQSSREAARKQPQGPAAQAAGAAQGAAGSAAGSESGAADAGKAEVSKPVIAFISTANKEAAKVPAAEAPPAQGPFQRARAKVVSVITLYADQAEWLKKVSLATKVGKKRVDSQGIVRAVLDSVLDIDPRLLKCETEEDMAARFKLIRKGGQAPSEAAAKAVGKSAG
ncbi:MAG TPA: DUF2225 domain-containing protein [Bacillota bacterium]